MADVVYRSGYGTKAYGVAAYGLDGTIKEGASAVVTVSTTASAVARTRGVASVVVTSSSTASSAELIHLGSASASAVSATTGTVARVQSVSASASASAATSASVERIQPLASSVAASASTSASIARIQQPAASVASSLSITSNFVFLYEMNGTANCVLTVSPAINRVRRLRSTVRPRSATTCSMIEKWEPIAVAVETWSDIAPAPNGSFWQPTVASSNNIWQDVA